jgi:hypothetical protein
VEEREEADAVVFEQVDPERTDVLASLEVHTDGALVSGLALGQDQPPGHSMIRMFMVDEDEAERVLGAFVAFANKEIEASQAEIATQSAAGSRERRSQDSVLSPA